jgi:outer membrane protein TolC
MRRRLAPYGLVLLFAGCSTPSGIWDLPWASDPIPYSPPPALKVERAVKQGQYPIDLATVRRLAGANSLDIAYMREKAREAYAHSELADERLWPSLGPEFVYRRHEGLTQGTDGQFVEVDKQQAFAGVRARLRWEVGDGIFESLSAAQRYEGSLRALEGTELNVILEASLAYYDLVRDHLRFRVAGQSAAVTSKLEEQLDASVRAGRGFRGDVLRVRVQLAASRLQETRARESIQVTSIRLVSLLHLVPGIELVPAEEIPTPVSLVPGDVPEEQIVQEAQQTRPEVREAAAEIAAARHAQNGAVWGPLIPEVQVEALGGGLGPIWSDSERTEDYVVALGWRIGPGGLFDPGRRRLAESRVHQAEINLERVRQRVGEQVRTAFAQARAKREQLRVAEQAVRDAEEALTLNQERQAREIGLPLEVLQAEEALTRARLDHFLTIVEHNQAQLRLFAAVGRTGR